MGACVLGLTRSEVAERIGPDRLDAFDHWMRGQTVAICDGRLYGCEEAHGLVVYAWDVGRFVALTQDGGA